MNRVDRLVAIILLLQSKKVIRAKDIAEHFEISLRTVYRDMNALCEAGVPISAAAGEGYGLVEGYQLPPVMFTREEASALFLGGKFVEKLTDASLIKHAESALLKIQSVLPEDTQDYLQKLQASTALFFRGTPNNPGFLNDTLATIQDAIVHRKILSLEYYSKHRESFTERLVEPLGLVYYSNHWHLIAYCRMRQDYRDFRTDRIKTIQLKETPFPRKENFILKKYLQDFFTVEHPFEIQIKFDNRIVDSVREKYAFGLVEEKAVEDGTIMTFLIPDTQWVLSWLLSFGTMVTVISPDSLREKLLAQAQNLVLHYET